MTSGLPRQPDIVRLNRHIGLVPISRDGALFDHLAPTSSAMGNCYPACLGEKKRPPELTQHAGIVSIRPLAAFVAFIRARNLSSAFP